MNDHSSSQSSYRKDIDGLRAIAVLAVVIFHAFPEWLPGGFVGVDIFFVISGYLITKRILVDLGDSRFTFRDFYARRVRRIFPALALVLLSSLALGWYSLFEGEFDQMVKHALGGSLFVSNFLLMQESGYFDVASELKPFLHLWSLAIEEQFYLLFPVLIVAMKKLRVSLGVGLLILITLSFATSLYFSFRDPTKAFYMTTSRSWEILAGALLALVVLRRNLDDSREQLTSGDSKFDWVVAIKSPTWLKMLNCAGLFLIAVGIAVSGYAATFPYFWALLPVLGAALVIYFPHHFWFAQKLLTGRCLVAVGLISYPLYLWHWPVLSFLRIFYGNVPPVGVRGVSVVLSVALAGLTFRLVEMPLRRRTINAKVLMRSLAPMFVVVVASIFVIAGTIDARVSSLGTDQESLVEIHPTPEEARDECLAELGVPQGLNIRYCRLSEGVQAPTVAVIGDSHAAAAFAGISFYLQEDHDVRSVNLAGRLFLNLTIATSEADEIEKQNSRSGIGIANIVNGSEDIETLIILTRGVEYLDTPIFRKDDEPELSDPEEVYFQSLRDVLEVYRHKNVLFVLENPTLDFDPTRCSWRPIQFGDERCSVSRESDETLHGAFLDKTKELLREFDNVHVIDPRDAFCDADRCFGSKAGQVFYSDRNHLNTYGSFVQGKQISDAFGLNKN